MSVALNTKHLSSFISEEEYAAIYPQVEAAHKQLEAKNGPGSDFLGWMTLPRDYDKEEFARIKAAAAKIREDSDVLVVAGIGGSYLGARAVVEAVKGMYHNELEDGLKIYFCGNSISPTYLNNIISLCKGKRFSINFISKDATTIVDGDGDKAAIKDRIDQIKAEMEHTDSDFDREKLHERLAKLSGGVAVLRVGAATEAELKEKKSRIEDALQATRAAVEEGIVAGGGVALLHALPALDAVDCANHDEEVGVAIIRKALEAPMRTIAQNAGFEGSVVVEKVKGMKKGEGLNCANGEYGDMIAMGVSDPVKVTRTALQSAVSVAGLILITECSINEIPKEGPDLSALAGAGAGMGGMM